ncbi:MAG: RNA methyltransferase [Alphaproteobacteria bacterium]
MGVYHQPPVVILARPQMAENIGSAARAMMNCGLSDLRLVNPRDGWPNEAALPMAAGGAEIIKNAQLFDSVAAAAHDVSLVLAASARRRDMPIRDADPRTASSLVIEHQGKAALLFGPEASGLDNDEVAQADILVTAALNPDYPSLNLAQAVLLLAWEWRVAMLAVDKQGVTATPAGPQPSAIAERDYFFQRLEQALDDGGFFTSEEMAPTVKRNIRAMFNRAAPTSQEISTLHGVIQALTKQRKTPDKSG